MKFKDLHEANTITIDIDLSDNVNPEKIAKARKLSYIRTGIGMRITASKSALRSLLSSSGYSDEIIDSDWPNLK